MINILVVLAVVIGSVFGVVENQQQLRAGDEYLRNRVVMLISEDRLCTGIKVKTSNDHTYILSAGHCKKLLDPNAQVKIQDEDGKQYWVDFIAEDPTSDLMLLSSNTNNGIPIAEDVKLHQHVHTLTHGGGRPTYRTDGEMLNEVGCQFLSFYIEDEKSLFDCLNVPKFQIIPSLPPKHMMCITSLINSLATAAVIPGSSGGPLLDDNGALVGIVSALGAEQDYYFVRLADIKAFMKGR